MLLKKEENKKRRSVRNFSQKQGNINLPGFHPNMVRVVSTFVWMFMNVAVVQMGQRGVSNAIQVVVGIYREFSSICSEEKCLHVMCLFIVVLEFQFRV